MSALAPREVRGGVKNDNAVNTNATMNNNASMNTNTTMNNNASVNTNTTMNNNASMNTNTIPHNTNTNHTDANDIQSLTIQKTLLERKLQNMVELTERDNAQEEYQRELEAKQRTILRLTQANREFEQLCVGTITGTGDAAKLREENERLKKRVAELEAQVTELEEDKDKMREAMVKMCTEKWCV